eukprot:4193628-Alexandrium_andersonii.AAC.1
MATSALPPSSGAASLYTRTATSACSTSRPRASFAPSWRTPWAHAPCSARAGAGRSPSAWPWWT